MQVPMSSEGKYSWITRYHRANDAQELEAMAATVLRPALTALINLDVIQRLCGILKHSRIHQNS